VENQQLIVLLNNTGGTDLNSMSRGLKNILYGEPYDPPKKPIGEELYKMLESEGLEAAIAHFEELKSNQPEKFDLRESELNNLGYTLISEERLDEAIAIFQLNVKSYPGSANVYDSLGEAFMLKGQKKDAIKNYERSLELNPDNENAAEMLEKLKE
jgi:tetratricopeptide (TPR) repeat protein